ncbi:MAG: adenosylcobinamide-phosphate synthase CbiB [Pseudomonadota bacterium]
MTTAAILTCALLLDAALGEPRALWSRLPHPAVLMGRAVAWGDATLNRGLARRAAGAGLVAGLVIAAAVTGAALSALGGIVETLVVAILLAQRSLMDHVAAVAQALRLSLGDARRTVARIVGRDTAAMTRADVSRAAIESAAENFSDGVIAPAFWFLIAGLPGMLVYKVVNTADSMVGYRTPRHEAFGWAAARLDDLLNWIPARLTALLLVLTGGQMRTWRAIRDDAARHRSPNAGWPEAALARTLDVALAGPRTYDGQRREFPFVHPYGRRAIGPVEIDRATGALWRAWAWATGIVAALALLIA